MIVAVVIITVVRKRSAEPTTGREGEYEGGHNDRNEVVAASASSISNEKEKIKLRNTENQ